MDVSIIIVNYNTADVIVSCLESILRQKNISYEIFIVDNASTDHSLSVLNSYQHKITVITNLKNIGFGCAVNQAAKSCTGKYILVFNPDAIFSKEHDLQNLLQFMEQNPKIGLVSPKIIKQNSVTQPQKYYPGQKYSTVDFSHLPGPLAWVIGACMLIRREAFQQISGFDEEYFLYGEETDLCLRLRKAGWTIAHHDPVTVGHLGGASERQNPLEEILRKKQAGIHLFYQKHYPPQEVKKIIKNELIRTKIRILLLQLKKLIGLFKPNDRKKLLRYEVICTTSKNFLL